MGIGQNMNNVMSVDVEDYFQVEAFSSVIAPSTWDGYPARVEHNTRKVLELLARREVRATFFVLGWVAKRWPGLVQEIAAAGHEIASHGMSHQLIYRQSVDVFRQETRDSKKLLEDIVQCPVIGYRAATYSITERSLWALDILAEEGFQYDSSIFPMRHDRYGIPDANPLPHRLTTPGGLSLVEFPISVLRYGPMKIPVAGGGYFRLFPYGFSRWALDRINKNGQDFVFYIHPWEVDPAQPRVGEAGILSKFRHYLNLDRCTGRLERLLDDFEFTTMRSSLCALKLL